jgi:RND family efflux transporter MFP subunit
MTAAGITGVVFVAGGGAVSYATSQGTTPTYVTASVGSHPVVQTLQATGTTEPSSAATVSFAVSGTVATVPVAMGQKVTSGQVLATLDTTSLRYALATAQGQVANANLTLTQAESGQVSAASGTGGAAGTPAAKTGTGTASSTGTGNTGTAAGKSGTGTGSTGATSGNTGSTGGGTGKSGSTTGAVKSSGSSHSGPGSTASIITAQKVLLSTVRRADSSLAQTRTDLALATTVCSSQANPSPTPTPITTTTPTPTPTVTPSSSPPTRTPAAASIPSVTASPALNRTVGSAGPSTCIQAQQLVLRDESQLLVLQQGLSGQETSLDRLLTTIASTSTTPSTTRSATGAAAAGSASAGSSSAGKSSGTGTGAGAATSAAKAGGSTSAAGSTTGAVSGAQLAADQAAVDAANASVAVAQQQLSEATIVSPITGTVSLVGLTVGQQATAGSTTSAVDVIDPTGHGVSLSLDVTKIPQVKVGDKATVVPDGSATPLAATVSYIAAAPTTAGSTAYNVQLAFTTNPTALRDGIQAAVTITTAQAAGALAVPTSAVNHRGALDYVLVLNGGTTKVQIVTVGAVGATYTQVTQGLAAGQKVVLANPDQAIPTNTITGRIARITGGVTNTTGLLGATSGGGGAGFGGGGFGGGAAGATGARPGG